MGFFWQECWSGLPCPPPGNLPEPGIESESPVAPAWQADSLLRVSPAKPFYHVRTGSGPSPDIKHAGTLILDFPASRTVTNRFVFISPSAHGILLLEPEWIKMATLIRVQCSDQGMNALEILCSGTFAITFLSFH